MEALLFFIFGFLFMYVANIIDLGVSILQSKVNLFITKIQIEMNELAENSNSDQQLSCNIGFQYNEEDYYDEEDEIWDEE